MFLKTIIMHLRRPGICVLSLIIFGILISPCLAENIRKASFIPHWSPQAQFAGYYVACEKGLYKKYGLDVTILRGGPDISPKEFLEKGKADFTTMWLSTGIQKHSEGTPLVNIGQIIQRSALMLVAKKAHGIYTPRDMQGKKVGLWKDDFQIQPEAFFRKYNLNVKIIPQSSTVNLFLRDGVDVASAMWYNEYHTIINSGINTEELTTFFFSDYGLNFPEDGIYTLEKKFRKDPSLSCAFVRGSIEGWLYAFAHPDEALDIVLQHMSRARIPANRVHQKWMLEKMKDLMTPLEAGIPAGTLRKSDFLHVAEELKKKGFIKEVPEFESFSQKCFMHAEK